MSEQPSRADYPHLEPMPTRWMDNDIYGHVNNATYYSYFDTVANTWMITHGLDPAAGSTIAVIAESGCHYHHEIAFPDQLVVGLRVGRLGNRAVTWELAIFKGDNDLAAAHGHFVHVFVDRETRRPIAMPDQLRESLKPLVWPADS